MMEWVRWRQTESEWVREGKNWFLARLKKSLRKKRIFVYMNVASSSAISHTPPTHLTFMRETKNLIIFHVYFRSRERRFYELSKCMCMYISIDRTSHSLSLTHKLLFLLMYMLSFFSLYNSYLHFSLPSAKNLILLLRCRWIFCGKIFSFSLFKFVCTWKTLLVCAWRERDFFPTLARSLIIIIPKSIDVFFLLTNKLFIIS